MSDARVHGSGDDRPSTTRRDGMTDRQRFEGRCDVCGADIATDYDPKTGIIDIGITEEGRAFTWIRHYATAPPDANPDCAVYSSRVYEVPWPREEVEASG